METTLGERLAAERRKAGKSIVDVEGGTHIRAALIEALENGDHSRLPSPAYVRGYIQSYAKYLEIPAEPLLRLYEEETGQTRVSANPVGELPADTVVPRREHAHVLPMRTAAMIAAVIALLSLALWGAARALSGPEETPPVPPTASDAASDAAEEEEAASIEDTETAEGVADSETATTTESEDAAEPEAFTLVVKIAEGGASWLVVEVDGEQVHAGTMRDGEREQWEVSSEAVISQIGKPSEVSITRDGEDVDIPQSDDPPTVTLTAEEGSD